MGAIQEFSVVKDRMWWYHMVIVSQTTLLMSLGAHYLAGYQQFVTKDYIHPSVVLREELKEAIANAPYPFLEEKSMILTQLSDHKVMIKRLDHKVDDLQKMIVRLQASK